MINKDMTIMEVVQSNPKAVEILQSMGMHCIGCAVAHGETIEQAAGVHGLDVEELLKKLNNDEK